MDTSTRIKSLAQGYADAVKVLLGEAEALRVGA